MLISIITLFPEMFDGVFSHSILKRGQEKGALTIQLINHRDFGIGKHKIVDDKPYGGGIGMLLRVDVLAQAIASARKFKTGEKVILLDPKGTRYTQEVAENLSKLKHIILVCGHYEGFDERINDFVDMKISLGDFVLSGGEIPAMAITESIGRLTKGVLAKENATVLESFSKTNEKRILEHPHYTRPQDYKGKTVPKILLSGDQKKIDEYRTNEAQRATRRQRPDLLK